VELQHRFAVPVPIEEAWPILLDIRRVASCMPGAAVDSVDGDDFTGTVKVKLGPISLTYRGDASFIEKDERSHVAVLEAHGRDARGNGTASARVTGRLEPDGSGTTVHVLTQLDITGRPAQFGRGVMKDVADRLMGQFANGLADTIRSERAGTESSSEADEQRPVVPALTAVSGEHGTADGDRLDLLGAAGWPLAKRILPAVLVLYFAVLVRRRRRSRWAGAARRHG
jgi:carbon monoxide dehydrogenase subunit G